MQANLLAYLLHNAHHLMPQNYRQGWGSHPAFYLVDLGVADPASRYLDQELAFLRDGYGDFAFFQGIGDVVQITIPFEEQGFHR